MPLRLRIVERFFHCRIRQIEPVLQEIDTQRIRSTPTGGRPLPGFG
jgi:hypothetical protein